MIFNKLFSFSIDVFVEFLDLIDIFTLFEARKDSIRRWNLPRTIEGTCFVMFGRGAYIAISSGSGDGCVDDPKLLTRLFNSSIVLPLYHPLDISICSILWAPIGFVKIGLPKIRVNTANEYDFIL